MPHEPTIQMTLPTIPWGYVLDADARSLVEGGLPSFGWQLFSWEQEIAIVETNDGPFATLGGDGHYVREYVGIELSSGHVVRVRQIGEEEPRSDYYARTLRIYLEELREFNALLPLYSTIEWEDEGSEPVLRAVNQVETALNALDSRSLGGAWQYHVDSIWSGDFADFTGVSGES